MQSTYADYSKKEEKRCRDVDAKRFQIAAVHRNAIERSRELKPEIPVNSVDGIPIRKEIELEIIL
jgi:hypothetical protein